MDQKEEPETQENKGDKDNNVELGVAKIEIKELRRSLAEEKEKAEKNMANWQRTQADLVNFRRQAVQEKEDLAKFANSALILKILPFLDDMERAIASAPPELAENKWVVGVKLIGHKLMTILEGQGVSAIKAEGEKFDPNLHEAVRQDTGEDGVILAEVEKGYKLKDRVIRPSKVVVGNGEV
jgi:molecular chaperone GrpE